MEAEIKFKVANEQIGVAVFVTTLGSGFAVVLKDTDADEYFPTVIIKPNLQEAVDYALKCADNI